MEALSGGRNRMKRHGVFDWTVVAGLAVLTALTVLLQRDLPESRGV
jgi:hypothetical protein